MVRLVFPVFVTGLHCGKMMTRNEIENPQVFPVFVTGLHCGKLTYSPEGADPKSSRSS